MTGQKLTQREPGAAVRVGAARALAEILRARRPDLAMEVTFEEINRDRRSGGDATDAEVRRLEPRGDDSHPVEPSALAHPDDAERAA